MSLLRTVQHLLTYKRAPSNKRQNCVAGGPSTQTANVKIQNHTRSLLEQAPKSLPKSPIHTLPIEVLSLIFSMCLPDLTTEPYERHSWTSIPSFNISWVCSDWRTMALGTPLLWTVLADIDLTRSSYASLRSYLRFIGELLHRSGNMDLTIFIYAPGVYESEAIKHPIINFLLESRERWGTLMFHSGIPVINLFCNDGHEYIFPRLRKLGLNMCIRPPHMKILGFANAPLLEDVSVSGLFPDQLLLPYEHLKSYREGGLSHSVDPVPAFLKNVLMHGKRLERLEILGINYFIPMIPNPPRNLKVLHLRLDSMRSPDFLGGTFLDALNLPFLEELKFRGMYIKDNAIVEDLLCRSIMSNQQLPLRILHLRSAFPTSTAGNLWRFLQMTPFLQELSIDMPHINDMIQLIQNMAPSGCLSRLQRMAIHLEQKNIKDRWRSTLDDLTAKFCEPLSSEATGDQCRELQLIFPSRFEARYVQDMLNLWNTVQC
ncbi:hypothetical protein JR316_0001672 [Psilocybe cubensis]|uniref:Uncharacterized protein n=2 Tax=Psilocybe cubensis TaxID=181762 RepID=A0ACB8HAL5_PSICU|nr:hypothetical protein JR316_0001672 [Psilocybe cubensis]KAH9484770.1 hypothetical protein JR316_0001672 [Psilocybe cubensis]